MRCKPNLICKINSNTAYNWFASVAWHGIFNKNCYYYSHFIIKHKKNVTQFQQADKSSIFWRWIFTTTILLTSKFLLLVAAIVRSVVDGKRNFAIAAQLWKKISTNTFLSSSLRSQIVRFCTHIVKMMTKTKIICLIDSFTVLYNIRGSSAYVTKL